MDSPEEPGAPDSGAGRFEEGLAYLLVFSEALLDLVPDPVGVLDDHLRVRNANGAFAHALGFDSLDALRGTSLAEHPLLRAGLPDSLSTLGEALVGLCERPDEALAVERLEVADANGGGPSVWAVHALGWDTEDPAYRRVLLWARRRENAAAPSALPPTPPTVEPAAPSPERPADAGTVRDRLAATLLETLDAAACVLDWSFHVRLANRRVTALLGTEAERGDPAGRPLLDWIPELRPTEILALLDASREGGAPVGGTLSVQMPGGRRAALEIHIQPIAREDDESKELLVLFHEVESMTPPPLTTPEAQAAPPEGPQAILAPDRLARWPTPTADRVLLVEADSWTRMAFADALRRAGFSDLATCDSGAEAWARHDPAFFALAVVGFDSAPEDAAEFCARMTRDAARVPVLVVAETAIERARVSLAAWPIAGLLPASPQSQDFLQVATGLARRGADARRASAAASAGPAPAPVAPPAAPVAPISAPSRVVGCVLLGAQEGEVAALHLLHRTRGVRVRLVYDSDAEAIGLEVAQRLGIPAISGTATLLLDPPPDAVVIARRGLEGALERLKLEKATRVGRDEIELFAADPEAFLHAEKEEEVPAAATAAPARETAPAREMAPPRETDAPLPEPAPAPPAPTPAPTPALDAIVTPPPIPEMKEAPPAPAVIPPAAAAPTPAPPAEQRAAPSETRPSAPPARVARAPEPMHEPEPAAGVAPDDAADFVALSGAFDLLFDFDRLCRRVLELGIRSIRGVSGSLMLLDEDGRTLRIVSAVGLSDLVVRETRQRVGEGIAGRVADEGESLLLVGTIGDERFPVRGERPEIPSAVCVPIMADGRVLGVLNVNSEPMNDPFDNPELRTLATWARQVGPAIDRSRQLQQVRGRSFELSVRGAIESIAMSGEDLVTRLRRVATRATELLNIDTCAIWLHDPKTERVTLRALSGGTAASMEAVSMPIGTGLVGWVARHRRPLVLRHSPDDPGDIAALRVTSVAVPIRHHTDLVGVLSVEATTGSPMDQARLALVATVAAVVGEQVGASRAQATSEHMVTMLSALSELGVAFGAARERRGLGRLVAFTAATVLESDVATVRTLRDDPPPGATDAEPFELLASHGATPGGADDPLAELENRVARELVARRMSVTDADLPVREAESLLTRSNVASLLGIPMIADDDELLGMIVVYRVADATGRDHSYGEPEREIAARLADYAAAAAQRFTRSPHGGSPEVES